MGLRKPQIGLSKSRITLFEQCPKRLWLAVHRPDLAEEDDGTRAAFADGHRVGELACSLHPDGIMISANAGLGKAVEETAALLSDGWNKPIFEATFAHKGVLVRVDILLPTDAGWHVAEVKNTAGVKDYHLGDLATQIWVMRGAGVPIATTAIRHLDRTFTLTREADYDGLFLDTVLGDEIEPIVATRDDIVAKAQDLLQGAEPEREMGPHCDAPFVCSFKTYCGRRLPPAPDFPVTLLPDAKGKQVARQWLEQGVADLIQVPSSAMPNAKLKRVHAATVSGEAWHDREAIRAEIADWAFPRTFLDFEAIQFAIPRWVGTRPFAQVPFQFSAHIEFADGSIAHRAFLSIDGKDPRRACAEALVTLPETGAVVAWSAGFERACLNGLADLFPDLAPALASLADRLVDPLPVVRRHYYHRDMRGSWSLKCVLPTLDTTGYTDLVEVKSGTDAQAGYLEAINPSTTPERAAALSDSLLEYCKRDTEAMMIVLDALTR
jgi:hypothetical protein